MGIGCRGTRNSTGKRSATITIGLEENKDSYQEPEEVIRVADGRMYYGKQHGKNILISEDMV